MAQPSLTVTSATDEMVVDCVTDNHIAGSSDTGTAGGGQTKIYGISAGTSNHSGFASDEAGAATVSMDWTGVTVTNRWGQVGVSLAAAATGPAPAGRPMLFRGS